MTLPNDLTLRCPTAAQSRAPRHQTPRPTRCGTRTRSSISCTSRPSSTPIMTGSAISKGCATSWIICRISGSRHYGCCRFIRRRCAMTAMTSPTTRTSIRHTAKWPISRPSSERRTAATSGSSPSSSSITLLISILGFSARAARSRARSCAIFTSGAIPTRSSRKPASFFSIPKNRTGPGTRWRRPITGIASTRISPT